MKKFNKVMLIMAGVLGVTGVGLSISGVAMGATLEGVEMVNDVRSRLGQVKTDLVALDWDDEDDWDDDEDDWDDDDYRVRRRAASGNGQGNCVNQGVTEEGNRFYEFNHPQELDVELRADELILEEYEGELVRVEVANDDEENVTISCSSQELEIKSSKIAQDRIVTIYYPTGSEFQKVSLGVDMGNILLISDLTAAELDLSAGAGNIENEGTLTAREIDIEVGAGGIELTDVDGDRIDGECAAGELILELAGRESDYSYQLECGMGNILINGEEYSSIAGEKTVRNPDSIRTMNLECGMGTIEVDFQEE